MSPGEAIFVPSSPKTGINLRDPRPPQSLNHALGRCVNGNMGKEVIYHIYICIYVVRIVCKICS